MKRTKIIMSLLFIFYLHTYAAIIDTAKVYSTSMNKNIEVLIITPQCITDGDSETCPSLYLLHGYGDTDRMWLDRTKPDLPQIADHEGWYIIIPDAERSWYWDSPIDSTICYETFMTKELVPYIDNHYKTFRNKTLRAITGFSMGGQGSFYLAMRHKDIWGNAGSMSGGLNICKFPTSWDMAKLLGTYNENKERWKDFSISSQINNINDGDINLIMDCGSNDFFLNVNKNIHQELLDKNINHVFMERIGSHNHTYWNSSIDYQILFFRKNFNKYYTPPLSNNVTSDVAYITNNIINKTFENIPQSYMDNLTTTYNSLETTDSSTVSKLAVYDALIAALEARKNNIKGIQNGYYTIEGYTDKTSHRGVLYENGSYAKWKNLPNDSILSNPKVLWKISLRRTVDNVKQFDIQNASSKFYFSGTNTKIDTHLPLTADTTKYTFNFIDAGSGYHYITSSHADEDYENKEYRYLHLKNHSALSGDLVLWNECASSRWYFRPVDESIIKQIDKNIAQNKFNQELQTLVDKCVLKLNSSRIYTIPEDVKVDLNYDDMGLVTDKDHLWSNADHNLLTGSHDGNGIAALLNNKVGQTSEEEDWFHSSWTATGIVGFHNLQMDLGEKVNTISLKMSPRKPSSLNAPTAITIYACNDTNDNSEWNKVKDLTELFKSTNDSVVLTNGIELGDNYQFLRLDVTSTLNNSLNPYGNVPFFTLSEFRVYKSSYDSKNSPYENIENANIFSTTIDKAKTELEINKGTQTTFNKLQNEYDAFVENFDKNEIKTNIRNENNMKTNILVNVYNTSGIPIRKNVNSLKATKDLPQGIYIVGTKKEMVNNKYK